MQTFQLSVGPYILKVSEGRLPSEYVEAKRHAKLVEELDLADRRAALCTVQVADAVGPPFLLVSQTYSPSGECFSPGVLVVPETRRLFLGAGERLLAYDLASPARIWEEVAEMGFLSWARHGDVVIVSAELGIAAWDLHGRKLWSRFVEPPWEYTVEDGVVRLEVMGSISELSLAQG